MKQDLKKLYPQPLWAFFKAICGIPHPSKKEGMLADFVRGFCSGKGLKTVTDKAGNIVITKPAMKGMENRKRTVLQAHLDMVPQKNGDVAHDFDKDPIAPCIEDGWVKARGTTLGADNGIGVAAALAVLDSKDVYHGPLEILLTVDEETGMTGAVHLSRDALRGDILINMDSEEEGKLYIGCAGANETTVLMTYVETPAPKGVFFYRMRVFGLMGGHSGVDIHLGRGNAIKILNRFLWLAEKKCDVRIAAFEGGGLRNAIPREAAAMLAVPEGNQKAFLQFFREFSGMVKNEYRINEPGLKMEAEKMNGCREALMDKNAQARFLNAVYGCPNGVMGMMPEMPDVVETSTNLAMIKSGGGSINIGSMQRSSADSKREELCHMLRSVFEPAGAEVYHSEGYPGWKPDTDSEILKVMRDVYLKRNGGYPDAKVIHAGLECGILKGLYPEMDMISFGPTIVNAHSPSERVNIDSTGRFWDLLLDVLGNIPEKRG